MEVNSPEDADLVIQKLGFDMGIHRNPRKGTLDAPDRILEGLELDRRVLVDEVFPDEFDLEETHRRIAGNTAELLEAGKPVLSLGGDHSVSFPVVKAVKERNPELELVWLDAHADLKEKVGGHVSHDVVVRELLDHGFSEDEIWIVGVTRLDDDEQEFLEGREVDLYRADELDAFLEDFDAERYYLSLDIDVLREADAPGTGYPDGELEMEDLETFLGEMEPLHADLVEVAPPFDRENRTVRNARTLVRLLAESLEK